MQRCLAIAVRSKKKKKEPALGAMHEGDGRGRHQGSWMEQGSASLGNRSRA